MMIRVNSITVNLTDGFIRKISKFEQNTGEFEKGGILLGKHILDSNYYEIVECTLPTTADECGRDFFIRNKEAAQLVINNLWDSSEGTINYLGEWHTHACVYPDPSVADKHLMKSIVYNGSNIWGDVFMLILGQRSTFYLGVATNENKGELVELVCKGGLY